MFHRHKWTVLKVQHGTRAWIRTRDNSKTGQSEEWTRSYLRCECSKTKVKDQPGRWTLEELQG